MSALPSPREFAKPPQSAAADAPAPRPANPTNPTNPTANFSCPPGLSPAQTALAQALAAGASLSAAVRVADIHRSTYYDWLKSSPVFRQSVESAQEHYRAQLRDSLLDLSSTALSTLGELLSPDTAPAVRLRAALAILRRPQYPAPSWSLPANVYTDRQQSVVSEFVALKADYDASRQVAYLNKHSAEAESASA